MHQVILVMTCMLAMIGPALARDGGQWEETAPEIREWYRGLMQPDNPGVSCCGEADAYYADEVHVRNGKTYATITDNRPDAPLMRMHVPVGTEIEIPDAKLKWDRGNPSGHSVVFLSRSGAVYCFVSDTADFDGCHMLPLLGQSLGDRRVLTKSH